MTSRLYDGQKVKGVTLEEGSPEWHCVCEGLFMWETMAMNMRDMVKLKVKDVKSDIICYERSKTGGRIEVVQTELSREIADRYAKGKAAGDYLFRYGWDNTEQGHRRYNAQRQRWGECMTRLVKEMGYEMNRNFTTYVLRHTFATALNANGVTRDDIGKMYGHQDSRSIDTYIGKEDIHSLSQKAREALAKI